MMRRLTRGLVLSAGAIAGIPLALFAQQTPVEPADAEFGEVIHVELVNVDVWVTDADGRPVSGLSAGDFSIEHDGTQVEVTHFVEQGQARARSQGSQLTEAGGDDLATAEDFEDPGEPTVVIFFDQMRIHPAGVASMVKDLEGLLEDRGINPEQILVLRQDTNLHIETPFGSSRRQVMKALQRLEEIVVEGAQLESQSSLALGQIQDLWQISEQRQGSFQTAIASVPDLPAQSGGGSVMDRFRGGGGREGRGSDVCTDFMTQAEPMALDWARFEARRTRLTLENLRHVGGFLAGMPGVKSLIYVSDGLETQPGAPLGAYLAGLCPGQSRVTADLDAEALDQEFLRLTRDLNARRVTVYAVQAGGLTSSRLQDASQGGFGGRTESARGRNAFETRRKSGEREGLQLLAGETGGRLVVRRNDLSQELLELAGDFRPQYSLAYPLPKIDKPNAEAARRSGQRIEVKVAGDERTVRFRRGWAEIEPDRLLADRLDGALFLGLVENPLDVRLGAAEMTVNEQGQVVLPLRVMVPAAHLTPSSSAAEAQVKVRVVARRLETQELVAREKSFRVPLPETPGDQLSVLPIELVLPPGTFTVAVGLRDEGSLRTSVISTEIDLSPQG